MNSRYNLRLTFFLFFILVIFLNSCTVYNGHKCDWDFITSVGGLKIDDPYLTKEGWFLPIQCDVSGLTKITNEPTTMNSALKCIRIEYSKRDSAVFIAIYVGTVGNKNNSCRCEGVNLGDLEKGKYSIYYNDDLHFIRNIKLE
jgi:hypothetical protein